MAKNNNFESAVSSFRTAIRRRISRNSRISAVDLRTVATAVKGSVRGAAIREAFRQLEAKNVVTATNDKVRGLNHHPVTVYARA